MFFSQDFFTDENAGEGFSSDSEESSQEGFGSGFGDSSFGNFSDSTETSSSPLQIGGELKYQSRYYTGEYDAGK